MKIEVVWLLFMWTHTAVSVGSHRYVKCFLEDRKDLFELWSHVMTNPAKQKVVAEQLFAR